MKLNYKRTVLIGFAFFSICAFWQMYNSVIPLILTNTFHMNETWSGAIMAADNVLALFLLPFFGAVSDKCAGGRLGRRMPFILIGTGVAVALMNLLPVLDNRFAASPSTAGLAGFIAVLGLLLIAMGTYRSPAVALMPDCTPKPLRSKGNAVINLMGALGGIVYLICAAVLYPASKTAGLDHVNYQPLFAVMSVIMLASIAVLLLTVRENRLTAEVRAYEAAHPEEDLTAETGTGERTLPKEVKRSLAFLLVSVSLWFIGYNAVETWFTTYAASVWGMSLGTASLCLTIATAGAIVSYLPAGILASKIGRKKCILGGCVLLAGSFFAGFLLTQLYDHFTPVLYVIFVLVGVAWAFINVNSLPMVVEMCDQADTGKFTGYYYTFSMAAQTITPVVAGTLMNRVSYAALFPYAALFVALAFVTMLFVKHGDSKAEAVKGIEAFDIDM